MSEAHASEFTTPLASSIGMAGVTPLVLGPATAHGGVIPWHYLTARSLGQTATLSTAYVVDTIYAARFSLARSVVLEGLAFAGNAGAGANVARIGIYANEADGMYPAAAVYRSGELSGAAPIVSVTGLALALAASVHYWAVVLLGVAGRNAFAANVPDGAIGHATVPAVGSATDYFTNITAAFPYAALPDPFPAGGVLQNSTVNPAGRTIAVFGRAV